MNDGYTLIIDCGGTNTKIMLFDSLGKMYDMYRFSTKRIEHGEYYEIDLNELKNDIIHGVQRIGKDRCIQACTCIGHGKGLYVLDKQRNIFCHGILSMDQRANTICQKFKINQENIYEISHQQIKASQASVLLNWLKSNRPDVYHKIGYVLSNKDFIRYILTGEIFQELGDASSNNFVNMYTKKYDKKLFEFFGIEEMQSCMPKLVHSYDLCGIIKKEIGIQENIPVYAGMFDVHACALASGIFSNGNIGITAGTWSINVLAKDKLENENKNLMCSLYLDNLYLLEASSSTSAGNLDIVLKKWIEKVDYEQLNAYLNQTTTKDCHVLFMPFLYGTNDDENAKASIIGLRSDTSKLEILRAVCEGVAFSHMYHLEQLTKEKKPIYISGGITYSSSWLQIFADVLERSVYTFEENEMGGLGGAMLVAFAQKIYPSYETAFASMSKVKKVYRPNRQESLVYQKKYEAYKMVLQNLKSIWNLL